MPTIYAHAVGNPDRRHRIRIRRDRHDPTRLFINCGVVCFTITITDTIELTNQLADHVENMNAETT